MSKSIARKSRTAATAPVATPEVAAPVVAAATETAAKRTVEKDRPTQNGVTRPSAGGACRAVWDLCDKLGSPGTVTIAAVKAAAPPELNPTNVQIEYYQHRKFHGVRGRVVAPKVVAAPAAE